MRIKNDSSYSDEELKPLLYYAEGDVDTYNVGVHIIDADHPTSGVYYASKYGAKNSPFRKLKSVRHHITLRIGPPEKFPVRDWHGRKFKRARRYLVDEYRDWKEGFLALAAHEFWHHYQYKNRRKMSEVDCIRYSYQRVLAYREGEARTQRMNEMLKAAKTK